MKTPIRIIVVGDFKGSSGSTGLTRAIPGDINFLIEKLKPVFTLGSGLQYRIESFNDFGAEAIHSLLSSSNKCSEDITSILHDKVFQQAEGAWRGLEFLVSRIPESNVLLDILDSSFSDLRRNVYDFIMKPEYDFASDHPCTVILADFDFSYRGESFEIFTDLAKMSEAIRAPFVAQTGAEFFNLKHLLHLPTIKDPLSRISSGDYNLFHSFRKTDTSYWACLMINRFLLRCPYNIDIYKEPADASRPEQYLFGRGIWILGANIINSFSNRGHLVGISGLGTGGEQLNIPYRKLPISRIDSVLTPLEASLPIDIVEGLPYLGLSPLSQIPSDMGGQNQPGMIYLHLATNMKHIPDTENNQYGMLTVHTSLAYSLMLGRISNIAYKHMRYNYSEDKDLFISSLKDCLEKDIWFKEKDEIHLEHGEHGILISYHPHLVIHTRRFEIEFDIPLQ